MPVIMKETSVGATSSNDNLVSGSAFEFARTRQIVSIGITASATGSFVTIQSGSDVVLEESPPYVAAVFPVIPDQMFYTDVMEAGDRLVIKARNPTAGAITLRTIVQITPA